MIARVAHFLRGARVRIGIDLQTRPPVDFVAKSAQMGWRLSMVCLMTLSVALGCQVYVTEPETTFNFHDKSQIVGPSNLLPDWHNTMVRANDEHQLIENCLESEDACTRKTKPLRRLILRGRDLSPQQQLTLVNQYVNRRRSYSRDRRTYREYDDYKILKRQEWSTLLDFIQRGGDCEDYATSKYALLKLLGFEPQHLRIMIVYDKNAREHHALVAVFSNELGTQLLDNDNAIFRKRPFSYRYVYSINENFIWDHSLDKERKPRRIPLKSSR